MKKILLFCVALVLPFLMIGCGKYGEKDLIKDLSQKVEESKGYYLNGELEIMNNEESYLYDVEVSYSEGDKFKVSLKNKTNNHEQIILKNEEGVYVLTPSLNKSFKFQSEWPYNNSQSYLLQVIMKDINNDNDKTFEEVENGYVITSKANYSNNKDLVKQKLYVDKNGNFNKVEVVDQNNNVKIKMTFKTIDLNSTFNNDYFQLENCMSSASVSEENIPASNINEIIFPMYIPDDTYLYSQNKVQLDEGERVILTFGGDKPFVLVQETTKKGNDLIIPVSGEPSMVLDTVGSLSESSVNWISNGIEYYVSSSALTKQELLDVANSMGVMPVGK